MGCMGMDSKLRTKPKALFGGFEGLSKAPGSRCKISSIWGRISWLISTSEPIFVSILTLFGRFLCFLCFRLFCTFFCIFTPFSAFFCNSLYTFFNLMDSLYSPGLYRFENAFSRFKKKKKEDNSPSLFFGHRFPSPHWGINFCLVGPLWNIFFDLKLFLLSSNHKNTLENHYYVKC